MFILSKTGSIRKVFASTPATQKEITMHHYTKKNARTTDLGCLLSSPKLLRLVPVRTMTDPGVFALIGTEHALVFAHVLATSTAAPV